MSSAEEVWRQAILPANATIGAGTIVMHGAIVNAGARVGSNCIINTRALLEHDATVEDHCHISTGAILNGDVCIGAGMVVAIRNIELALGDGIKRLTPSEARNKPIARKSLVASRAIKAGEAFTAENLTAKRPGTGISSMRWDEVMDKKALRDFAADELIEG